MYLANAVPEIALSMMAWACTNGEEDREGKRQRGKEKVEVDVVIFRREKIWGKGRNKYPCIRRTDEIFCSIGSRRAYCEFQNLLDPSIIWSFGHNKIDDDDTCPPKDFLALKGGSLNKVVWVGGIDIYPTVRRRFPPPFPYISPEQALGEDLVWRQDWQALPLFFFFFPRVVCGTKQYTGAHSK